MLKLVAKLDDQRQITKLETDLKAKSICDFVAKEIRYDPICRTELENRTESKAAAKMKIAWHDTRDVHTVEKHVIEKDQAYFMKYRVSNYYSILADVGGLAYENVSFTSQHL